MSSSLPSAATATPVEDLQGDSRWMDMHHRFVTEAGEREPDILWVGDDVVQQLANTQIWERIFCQMHSLNFGVSKDRTENLLWRLQNGELEGLAPKAIVLMVGTNNHGDSAPDIVEGIKAICDLIKDRQPQAYLVVLSLLPRGHRPNRLRERNAEVNRLLEVDLRGESRAQLLDLDPGFVQPDGTIGHHDMYDYLHLTQRGYERAFEPVAELLQQVVAEAEEEGGHGGGGGGGGGRGASGQRRTEAEGAADV